MPNRNHRPAGAPRRRAPLPLLLLLALAAAALPPTAAAVSVHPRAPSLRLATGRGLKKDKETPAPTAFPTAAPTRWPSVRRPEADSRHAPVAAPVEEAVPEVAPPAGDSHLIQDSHWMQTVDVTPIVLTLYDTTGATITNLSPAAASAANAAVSGYVTARLGTYFWSYKWKGAIFGEVALDPQGRGPLTLWGRAVFRGAGAEPQAPFLDVLLANALVDRDNLVALRADLLATVPRVARVDLLEPVLVLDAGAPAGAAAEPEGGGVKSPLGAKRAAIGIGIGMASFFITCLFFLKHLKRSPTPQTEEIDNISDEENVTDTNATIETSPSLLPGQVREATSPQANFAVGRQQSPTKVSPAATDEYKQMIVLSNYRHKRAMWRDNFAANEREQSQEDTAMNELGDAVHDARKLPGRPPLDERKLAALTFKKTGIGEDYQSTHNQEVHSGKPRTAKKMAHPEIQTPRHPRNNRKPAVDPSAIAAAETLLRTERIQQAMADALSTNPDGSTKEDDNNRKKEQTEIPYHATHGPEMTPRMRLQHKLLGQARSRMTINLAAAAPSGTGGGYFEDNWGADAVASDRGAPPAPERSEDTAATSGGAVAETASDPRAPVSATKDHSEVGVEQKGTNECCICLDAPASHIFVPCFHLCICSTCQIPYADGSVKECPMCREEFTTVAKFTKVF
eukprot:CAMPEP_0194275172 /NCGR_PEP_ID=MMETSP0169-20130528/8075_1 /TAXON_ID=218684 /ORGANISM="Corethron pennatum, Strain L29A3" /LENGTH=680 /DNA_ID=CAMNT_0039018569 /DNA_START=252 /DNA_END=2294 /DNA_ORIENTATION=-